ncbi:MAG: CRISPR-associated endonuclease Cas2 [Anaerolineae bacterium]|nr:CRISPR-associated endonuclease Cas2 [Anaerolineae bacterium]
MFVVVSYDIVDDRRRRKVMKTMEGFGERVQYSVFECHLQPRDIARLRRRLRLQINEREDDIRFYVLCEACAARVITLGKAQVTAEMAYRII